MQNSQTFDISKKTFIISYLSQFFQYGISLLVLPFILSFFEAKDLGLWYVFLSISSLVSLLDFGFSSSIQRNVAYVASGAKNLLNEGVQKSNEESINIDLFVSLLKTSSFIYKKISLGVIMLSLTIGTIYLKYILKEEFSFYILSIWIMYSFAISINFYYSYILSFLKGLGLVAEYNKNIIISKSVYITFLAVMILSGLGLLSLVIAYFANSIIMVILGINDIKKKIPNFLELYKNKNYNNLFPILWKNAKNSGIVSIGVFLLSQSGIFISGLFLTIEEVAQLGLLLQLFGILVVLSRVYLTTCIPRISFLWIKDYKDNITNIFLRCQIIGYIIYITGVSVILFLGNFILQNILHSKVLLPPTNIILLYALFYLMELTHGNCCSLISTSNKIPFTRASIIAGVISIILTILLCKLEYGMISFPIALILGSLPYNSWKWPLYTYNLLKNK